MIWIHELYKSYKERKREDVLFSGVNLLIPSGLCIGILGSSGCGKSTLMKMIAGAELPSKGTIRVEGSVLWSQGILMALHAQMTLQQNLRFLSRLYIYDDQSVEKVIDQIIEEAKLKEYRKEIWSKIPANRKKTLNHSIMLHLPVDLLLLDGQLSPAKNVAIKKKMIRRIKRRGTTLFASANEKKLREVCDAGIVIDRQKLHYFDSFQEAIQYKKKVDPHHEKNS